MSKRIITVSREFGSGGHKIGLMLAEKLGIPYYDREIIFKVAEETGLAQEFIEKRGEYAAGKSIFSYAFASRADSGLAVDDLIYQAQAKIIRDIADKESCVIIGRCADYILKDRDDVFNVFIYGEEEDKIARIAEVYEVDKKKSAAMIKEMDKKRKVNYEYCTDRKWGTQSNYDACLNSSTFGYERCVDLIISML